MPGSALQACSFGQGEPGQHNNNQQLKVNNNNNNNNNNNDNVNQEEQQLISNHQRLKSYDNNDESNNNQASAMKNYNINNNTTTTKTTTELLTQGLLAFDNKKQGASDRSTENSSCYSTLKVWTLWLLTPCIICIKYHIGIFKYYPGYLYRIKSWFRKLIILVKHKIQLQRPIIQSQKHYRYQILL